MKGRFRSDWWLLTVKRNCCKVPAAKRTKSFQNLKTTSFKKIKDIIFLIIIFSGSHYATAGIIPISLNKNRNYRRAYLRTLVQAIIRPLLQSQLDRTVESSVSPGKLCSCSAKLEHFTWDQPATLRENWSCGSTPTCRNIPSTWDEKSL